MMAQERGGVGGEMVRLKSGYICDNESQMEERERRGMGGRITADRGGSSLSTGEVKP